MSKPDTPIEKIDPELETLRQEWKGLRRAAIDEAFRAERVLGRLDATIDWLRAQR